MLKKALVFIFCTFLLANMAGCLVLAGAAGGAGTAIWLGGKLSQQVDASYERTINAAKSALKSLRFDITKFTKEDAVTQIKSKYTDGREIWIDVRKITEDSSKVEVRVGATGDKEAASKILERIERYL